MKISGTISFNRNALIYKRKQASLIFGKPLSYGDKIQKELLMSIGTKPQNKSEIIVRVTGDCPLIDVNLIDKMILILNKSL